MPTTNTNTLIVDTNPTEFFQELVTDAVNNQHVTATEDTVYYLVNLLSSFMHSKALFSETTDGLKLQPLAEIYGEALAAPSSDARNQALKRLGDLALFISGIFTDSLNRKVVDVDYYIAMGGNAYSYLSDHSKRAFRWHVFSEVFEELATNFTTFVDVLGEVSEQTNLHRDTDIMRLYELWLRTGSQRAAQRLQRQGIYPITGSASHAHH